MQQAEPFVLLELFTSEGCSDCPAAEVVLNDIALEAFADRSYVYALSFHVDYWNKLGWKDEFASAQYSDRQRYYRKLFGNEVVYTPQAVINGIEEFVGSDKKRMQLSIKRSLQITPSCYFTMTPNENWTSLNIDLISITDSIKNDTFSYSLNAAIVERSLITQVKRGENADKTLRHENVVRYLNSVEWLKNNQVLILEYEAKFTENHSLIAFIQNNQTGKIIGANIWNY